MKQNSKTIDNKNKQCDSKISKKKTSYTNLADYLFHNSSTNDEDNNKLSDIERMNNYFSAFG